jgi:putative transcriptional regulator
MKDQNILKAAFETSHPHSSSQGRTEIPASEIDSRPMTAEERQKARRRPRVAVIRRALRLTQEQFSAEFGIPIGTLRDWEQERAEPDATAQAYLRAIAGNAEAVAKALKAHPIPGTE